VFIVVVSPRGFAHVDYCLLLSSGLAAAIGCGHHRSGSGILYYEAVGLESTRA
jgi:hypothetical protein